MLWFPTGKHLIHEFPHSSLIHPFMVSVVVAAAASLKFSHRPLSRGTLCRSERLQQWEKLEFDAGAWWVETPVG